MDDTKHTVWSVLIVLACLLLCIGAALQWRRRNAVRMDGMRLFFIFPLSQAVLLCGFVWYWLSADRTLIIAFLSISILVCIGADMLLFRTIGSIAQKAKLEVEQTHLQQLMEIQQARSKALSEKERQMKNMQDDISRQVDDIRKLLESERADEARAYVGNMLPQYTRNSQMELCPNYIVDALLRHKVEEAKQQGIQTILRILWPDMCEVSNVDLIGALSNLYDNAMQACTDILDAVIDIRVAPYGVYLVIRFENPMGTQNGQSKGEERGTGFYILRDIAEKYSGNFGTKVRGGIFCAELILRMKGRQSCIGMRPNAGREGNYDRT